MKINPHYCRHCVVDAEMLPVMYPKGRWRKHLLAIHFCENPKRSRRDRKIARAQGFAGPLCDASITGECALFDTAPVER